MSYCADTDIVIDSSFYQRQAQAQQHMLMVWAFSFRCIVRMRTVQDYHTSYLQVLGQLS